MAKRNYKYHGEADLNNLIKTKSGHPDWAKSIGLKIPFVFDKLSGEFTIVDYLTPINLTAKHIVLELNGIILKPILPNSVTQAKFSNILDELYIEWEYEIGSNILDDKRNLTIIDRKRTKNKNNCLEKVYKLKCNICGFDGGEHYFAGNKREELWITEHDLKRTDGKSCGCGCCSGRFTITGINDVSTLSPWMIPYFQGDYNEAKRFSPNSHTLKHFKCIHCNTIKTRRISVKDLYFAKTISCVCRDKMSYPNKFAYFLFQQLLGDISYYENEYSPKWALRYRYDNYIELYDHRKIIIEMDGGLGHGNRQYKSQQIDIAGKRKDKIKDALANSNQIKVIRIDCKLSEFNYIKNNTIKELGGYFDLSKIDWNLIDTNSKFKNIYKSICEYYEANKKLTQKEIGVNLNLGKRTVHAALKMGLQFGWCSYLPRETKQQNNKIKIQEYWDKYGYSESIDDMAKDLQLSKSTIFRAFKASTIKEVYN